MTREQLQYFVGIAETQSFSQTACLLNISQSSVTKQLKALEQEWGLILFDRNNRHVALSESGSKLYPIAKEILKNMDSLEDEAGRLAILERSQLHIVCIPIMSQYNLTYAIKAFESQFPHIQVDVTEAEEPEIRKTLDKNASDILIARREMLPSEGLITHLLAKDQLTFVANEEHPLAKRSGICMEELSQELFMFMPQHTYVGSKAVSLCQQYFTPRILQYARTETILGNVESGRCVSLLMKKNLSAFQFKHIVIIPVLPEINSEIVIAVNKKTYKKTIVKKFINHIASS